MRVDSSIRSPKDIEGKTFAVNSLRSQAEFNARVWIANHGGDPSKVTFTAVPFAQMQALLDSGRVDVADFNDPYYSIAKKDPQIRFIGDAQNAAQPYGVATGAWCANANWLSKNPDLATLLAVYGTDCP